MEVKPTCVPKGRKDAHEEFLSQTSERQAFQGTKRLNNHCDCPISCSRLVQQWNHAHKHTFEHCPIWRTFCRLSCKVLFQTFFKILAEYKILFQVLDRFHQLRNNCQHFTICRNRSPDFKLIFSNPHLLIQKLPLRESTERSQAHLKLWNLLAGWQACQLCY